MTRFASALALWPLLAAAPLAAQAARDFQLPPAATEAPDSRVQGPVDTDAPVPVRPRAIATDQPVPVPAPSPSPTIPPVVGAPAPAAAPTRGALPRDSAAPSLRPQASPTQALPTTTPPSPAPAVLPGANAAGPAPLPAPATRAVVVAAPNSAGFQSWLWLAFGAVAVAGAAGFLFARRRRAAVSPPTIVAPAVPAVDPGNALALAVEAVRLDRSVLNATVGYRVTVRNRTARPVSGLSVEADLVSASRERSTEQQIALPDRALAPRHSAERLAPGQSVRFEGQVRLPLSQASAIWQGRVGLLVPLLRVRALAADAPPVVTTLVLGRREGAAERPQPFRLDEPPRSYSPLAQRVLDLVPASA